MSINNIGSNIPIQVNQFGGTGNVTLTSNGILYGNGTSALGVTSVGTTGQLLTSNGGVSAPSFQNSPFSSDNDFVFVDSISIPSTVTNFPFTTGLSSDYSNYMFIVMLTNTAFSPISIQLSTDGGSTYLFETNTSSTVYYRCTANFRTITSWNFNSLVSAGLTEPGGFYLSGNSNTAGSSVHILSGIMRTGNPSMIGQDMHGGAGGSGILPGYWQSYFTNSPILPNAFRICVQNPGAAGTILVYKMRTT